MVESEWFCFSFSVYFARQNRVLNQFDSMPRLELKLLLFDGLLLLSSFFNIFHHFPLTCVSFFTSKIFIQANFATNSIQKSTMLIIRSLRIYVVQFISFLILFGFSRLCVFDLLSKNLFYLFFLFVVFIFFSI